jgi:hypothetical protein
MAAMPTVVYDTERPSDFDAGTNTCSDSQMNYLRDAMDLAGSNSMHALLNTDFTSDVFNKWFGVGVNEPDSNVQHIMKKASDMMPKMSVSWDPICCNNGTSGSCFACGDSTLAFVTSYSYGGDDTKYSITWVRTCPNFWKFTEDEKISAGFVMYHELVHMVSTASDGYGNYSKSAGVNLAASEPDIARLQANNYMLYAMQNSMSPYDYAMSSTSWGGSVFKIGCEDVYSNCPDLVISSGCCDPRSTTGSNYESTCCASCSVMNQKDKCV